MNVLMVCLGNICRSPLAEGILREKIKKNGLDWTVDSAGTNGFHTGEAPHRFSQKIASQHGIDISHQRARNFIASDFEQYDKIYAMASDVLHEMKQIGKNKFDASKTALLLNEIKPGCNLDVTDPWYGPEAGYQDVFEIIENACEAIVIKYATHQKQLSTVHL